MSLEVPDDPPEVVEAARIAIQNLLPTKSGAIYEASFAKFNKWCVEKKRDMDKVIKEGTLRVLISESTCDVILSCKDHRLMAHKLILSIASPVFRELLRKNSTDSTTVIIIPDISSSMMSTILDYIYTGTSVVYSDSLKEFLSVARFLQIAVDSRSIESILKDLKKVEDVKKHENECCGNRYKESTFLANDSAESIEYCKMDVKKQKKEAFEDRSVETESNLPNKLFHKKKLPDLLPISSGTFRKNAQRRMCNVVVPSPWCQRSDMSFLGDPRAMSVQRSENEIQKLHIEDTNNNFQLTQTSDAPKCSPKSLDSVIRHLYLNSLDGGKDQTSTTQGEDYSKKRHFKCSESFQKDNSTTLGLPDPTSFSFSRRLAVKRFESKTLGSEAKLENDKSDITSIKCGSNKKQRTFSNNSSLEPARQNVVQNLSLFRKTTSLLPSSVASLAPSTHDSTSISNPIPLKSTNHLQGSIKSECKKSTKPVPIEPSSNSNDNDNLNDVSIDNSLSSDSSDDEKKEDEIFIKKKSYKCQDCGKSFSQLRNYKYHRSVHEGTKEFSAKCPECGKMFNDRGYLSSHMKIHRDRKEYACPNCPKRFNQRVAYNMHLRIHTGVKPHECPTCGKSFSRKMLLKQHQRVHTGERPYTCPECGKTFADRSNMSLHARLHTGVKPYGCNLCPKSFTKKHHLKTHMNFHTGLKPYTCENCGLAFSQSSNMRTHYKKCILKDSMDKPTKSESVSSAENNSS